MVCAMEEAPTGLVPWMIVRTHEYAHEERGPDGKAHRLHWQKGMFLQYRKHGQALLELRDRELHIYVEAIWPDYFMKVIDKTLQKLIADNWPGLKDRYYFAVPCPERPNGVPCAGRFNIEAMREFHEEGDETYRCQVCRKRLNIAELLYGFEDQDTREHLAELEATITRRLDDVLSGFKGLESRIASSFMSVMHAIASESKDGPRLFTIEPEGGNWHRPLASKYRLQLWCEAEGCQHPIFDEGKGLSVFKQTREWLRRVAPYANLISGLLKTILPLVGPAVELYFGDKTLENWGVEDDLDLAKEGVDGLLPEITVLDHERVRQGPLSEAERSGMLALHSLLRELDPNQERLGLTRIPTYTGDYLWLCQKHYQESQSKIPDKIE
jgi:internalin A